MRVCVSQAKHAVEGNRTWGVDGDTGSLVDMRELGVWDPLSVKVQTYKTAIEVRERKSERGRRGLEGKPLLWCVLFLCHKSRDLCHWQ